MRNSELSVVDLSDTAESMASTSLEVGRLCPEIGSWALKYDVSPGEL